MRKLIILLLLALLTAAACGGGEADGADSAAGSDSNGNSFEQPFTDAEAYPVFASSEITVGSNRFLVGLLNDRDAPIGSPEIDMTISFFDLAASDTEPTSTRDMSFIWINKPYAGLYKGDVRFDRAGNWGAEVSVRGVGLDETVRAGFEVQEESSTPAVGSRPPASDTPTGADVEDLSAISTDRRPDPRFYELSIQGALKSKEPFVVVFATPKFCVSQTCGPILTNTKRVAQEFPGVNFIHVEPYRLPADPAQLQPVKSVVQWGLPSEPWVFVVSSSGRITAKYEGVLGERELHEELQKL